MKKRFIERIEEESTGIIVHLDNGFNYTISKRTYADCINGNISDWINQLMEKSWCDINSLYEIGAILSNAQNSQVNWEQTFLFVEENFNYTENCTKTKKETVDEKLGIYGFCIIPEIVLVRS